MTNFTFSRHLIVLLCLVLLITPLLSMLGAQTSWAQTTYTITTEVTAGDGWIETVEPSSAIPAGTTKHYRIRPARGYMIGDVLLDGVSQGSTRYVTIPNVQADHTIQVSFVTFDQIAASNISTKIDGDTRILLFGTWSGYNDLPEVRRYFYEFLEAGNTSNYDIIVEVQSIGTIFDGLLGEYHEGRFDPDANSELLNTIAEGWDYIIPIGYASYQAGYPEFYMEGVNRFYDRAWFDGGGAQLILPVLSIDGYLTSSWGENVYRIGNTFRIPVMPVGYAWDTLQSTDSGNSTNFAYMMACMLYAQLFEAQPPATGDADKDNAAAVAWATWQTEKANTHYSGDWSGPSTPTTWSGGRSYLFGTSTMDRSVRKMSDLIGQNDPAVGSMSKDTGGYFSEVSQSGSTAYNNLSSRTYDYIWVQDKGDAPFYHLNNTVRDQFGQDPYFIYYFRYFDQTAGWNAENSGRAARTELAAVVNDNFDENTSNPNKKSRAPQTHVGWGRMWEARTDIQMMESDLLHASDTVMSMFAAQAYALMTGRDASEFSTWGFSDPTLVEQAGYAQRLGYNTIMQFGYFDINEPYSQSAYDVPIFNDQSIFSPERTVLVASDDPPSLGYGQEYYRVSTTRPFVVPAPGVLRNDSSTNLTAILQTPPTYGSVVLNPDGSFVYTPVTSPENYFDEFTYIVSDGVRQSAPATVGIATMGTSQPVKPDEVMVVNPQQTSITLIWEDIGSTEDGFFIERSEDGGDTWTEVGRVVADKTRYTDSDLTCGTGYDYRMASYNTAGHTYAAESWIGGSYDVYPAQTLDCPWPSDPTNLTVTHTVAASLTLSWEDNSGNEDGFRIERSFLSDSGWNQLASVVSNTTTYSDTNLVCDTTYHYRVQAFNTEGDSGYSNVAGEKTVACPANVPQSPTDLSAMVSDTAITLTWQSYVSETTTFAIERSTDGSNWSQIGTVTYTQGTMGSRIRTGLMPFTYVDTDITFGTSYYYHVRAFNQAGGSGYSNAVRAQLATYVYLPLITKNWSGYTIAGKVTSEGSGLLDATISDQRGHSAVTTYDGSYSLTGLSSGVYTITAVKSEYIFSPTVQVVTLPPNAANVDFIATSAAKTEWRVFEMFICSTCPLDQQAASVIENQLIPEYATQPVIFLEHPLDKSAERWQFWANGFSGDANAATSPMVMVQSGVNDFYYYYDTTPWLAVTDGANAAAAGIYTTYKTIIDNDLSSEKAVIRAKMTGSGQRVDDAVSVQIIFENDGQVGIFDTWNGLLSVLIYEEAPSGAVAGHLTGRVVRTVASQAVTITLWPGESETVTLTTDALSGVNWDNLAGVAILEPEERPGNSAFGNLHAVPFSVSQ